MSDKKFTIMFDEDNGRCGLIIQSKFYRVSVYGSNTHPTPANDGIDVTQEELIKIKDLITEILVAEIQDEIIDLGKLEVQ